MVQRIKGIAIRCMIYFNVFTNYSIELIFILIFRISSYMLQAILKIRNSELVTSIDVLILFDAVVLYKRSVDFLAIRKINMYVQYLNNSESLVKFC